MTNIRFVGDLSLWLGLVLAVIVGVLSWRYYRRESFDLPHRLRWILPLLRSAAFFLGIMILTGPVLHHRKVIGELGRIKIYVDASQSMGLTDEHISRGRKLMIARQQGWLEKGRIDGSQLRAAEDLFQAHHETLAGLQKEDIDSAAVTQLRDTLLLRLKSVLRQIPAATAVKNESQVIETGDRNTNFAEQFTQQLIQPLDSITTTTDQSSIDRAVHRLTAVTAAILPFAESLRSDFDNAVQQLVDAGDESIGSALAMFDETPRWRRAERSLLETPDALFAVLKQNHNVEILALHNSQVVELFDDLHLTQQPDSLSATPDGTTTDLASGIMSSQNTVNHSEAETSTVAVRKSIAPNTAVILMTDGQHNSGPSPLQTARVMGRQGIAFYPVSLGAIRQAPDLAVTGLEHPEMVFRKDRVRGTMIVRDLMPAGQLFVAEVKYEDDVLWQKQLLTDGNGERRIEFEFALDELVERPGEQFDSDIQQHAVTLAMIASTTPLAGESEPDNNQKVIRLAAITQNYRMLIVDGRSRWETRYLKNAFQRDSQWDVDVIIAGPGADDQSLPRGDKKDQFPQTREALFEYDLIIFGEVAIGLFADYELKWIRDFVETRGGGIIFIDGQRKKLQQFTEQNLGPLLPVEWSMDPTTSQPTMLQLTDKGTREPALTFEVDTLANQRFWNQIPAPHTINIVQALPGAEVLVEAVVDGAPVPAVVTRNYGAGRVLYLAFDETWRWRFKAADIYHQRIWNQLAKYVMPRPFAVSDEYVSVDTGPVSYKHGDSADIRIRLLGLGGKPATDAIVDALIWRDGRIVSTVSLSADADVPGIYRGRSGELSQGEHEVSVQASGFSQDVLKARGQFVVLPPESGELENSACNESLLKQMAAESGGVYLREEDIGQLSDLLSPLSSGRVVESDTVLWQSYWWFAAIVILLTMEWFLRKRAGLL
jgi:uncharacterized membrane protein